MSAPLPAALEGGPLDGAQVAVASTAEGEPVRAYKVAGTVPVVPPGPDMPDLDAPIGTYVLVVDQDLREPVLKAGRFVFRWSGWGVV